MKNILFCLCFSVFLMGIYSFTTSTTKCKDIFSDCTNGACTNFDYGDKCKMKCFDAYGTRITIQCTVPGALDDESVPTTGAP